MKGKPEFVCCNDINTMISNSVLIKCTWMLLRRYKIAVQQHTMFLMISLLNYCYAVTHVVRSARHLSGGDAGGGGGDTSGGLSAEEGDTETDDTDTHERKLTNIAR